MGHTRWLPASCRPPVGLSQAAAAAAAVAQWRLSSQLSVYPARHQPAMPQPQRLDSCCPHQTRTACPTLSCRWTTCLSFGAHGPPTSRPTTMW